MISVIIPCYNQARYLHDTIGCLQAQTYKDWECIIVDDGSVDDTEAIVKKYAAADSRIHYVKKQNGGVSAARNKGLDLAKGDFIQFLDGDDLLRSDKFAKSMALFDADNCDIVISNFEMCNEDNTQILAPYCQLADFAFTYKSVLLDWETKYSIPIHTPVVRTSLLKDFRFVESVKAYEDWILWLYVFSRSERYKFINEPLAVYRVTLKGATSNFQFLVHNRRVAFGHIMRNLPEEYHLPFFDKVNEDWQKECIKINDKFNLVLSTTSYKVGKKLVGFFSKIYHR